MQYYMVGLALQWRKSLVLLEAEVMTTKVQHELKLSPQAYDIVLSGQQAPECAEQSPLAYTDKTCR